MKKISFLLIGIGMMLALLCVLSLSASAADANQIQVDVPLREILITNVARDVNLSDILLDGDVDDTMLWYRGDNIWMFNYTLNVTWNSSFVVNPNTDKCRWLQLNTDYDENASRLHINGTMWVNDSCITGFSFTTDKNLSDWTALDHIFYVRAMEVCG